MLLLHDQIKAKMLEQNVKYAILHLVSFSGDIWICNCEDLCKVKIGGLIWFSLAELLLYSTQVTDWYFSVIQWKYHLTISQCLHKPWMALYIVMIIQWSLVYKRDSLVYKIILKYSNCPFFITMNLSYKTTCLIRPLLSCKRGGLCIQGLLYNIYDKICLCPCHNTRTKSWNLIYVKYVLNPLFIVSQNEVFGNIMFLVLYDEIMYNIIKFWTINLFTILQGRIIAKNYFGS